MKKLIFVLFLAFTLTALSFTVAADSNLTYTVSGSSATITGCSDSDVTDIVIPETIDGYTVTKIGYQAFKDCTSLTSVTIPSKVYLIDRYAFGGCTSLTSITIPDSVKTIDEHAFNGCTSLTSITLPDSTHVNSQVFFNTGYYNDPDNWEDDILYIGNHLVNCRTTKEGACSIKEGTIEIASFAFVGCRKITSATIPDSVTYIGSNIFNSCTSLTSITIPDSVTTIWGGVLRNTGYYNDPANWEDGLLYLGDRLFNCDPEKSDTASIKEGTKEIIPYAFSGCAELTSVTIPDSVTSVSAYAFQNCTSLSSVTIPNSVTSIGGSAFQNCTSLNSVTIPNSVTTIDGYAFHGCTSLTSITVPDSVTSISGYAFQNCTSLTSITIPDSVTYIYSNVFNGCTNLTIYGYANSAAQRYADTNNIPFVKLAYEEVQGTPTYTVENGNATITGCNEAKVTTIIIPETIDGYTVTKIGDNAFKSCTRLSSVTIPNSVTRIGNNAFQNCTSLTSITIPDSVTYIGNVAFYGCTSLTSITIPDSVTYIGANVFNGCTSLTSITIPDGVDTIWGNVLINTGYYNDPSNWEDDVLYLGNYLFNCKTTKSGAVSIKEGTKEIVSYAFSGCAELTSVTIPDSVTTIGGYAFKGCTGFTSFTIPDSVTTIDMAVFKDCTNLTSITIPDSVKKIGELPLINTGYYNDSSNWEDDVLYLGNYLIGCKTEKAGAYSIKEGIKAIAEGAFTDCSGLTSITIPDSVTSISWLAFNKCSNLTSITIPDSVTFIDTLAFVGCTNLTIYGYANSAAQRYADTNNIPFVQIAESTTENGAIFTLSSERAKPGETVKLTLSLKSDVLVNSIAVSGITYDSDILEFMGFGDYEHMYDKCALTPVFDEERGCVVIALIEPEMFDGDICTLEFKVNEEATDCTLTVSATPLAKNTGIVQSSSLTDSELTVYTYIDGDIDGDEDVDIDDAVYLFCYSMLPEYYPITYKGTLDFVADESIDVDDAIYLFNYSMLPEIYPLR